MVTTSYERIVSEYIRLWACGKDADWNDYSGSWILHKTLQNEDKISRITLSKSLIPETSFD